MGCVERSAVQRVCSERALIVSLAIAFLIGRQQLLPADEFMASAPRIDE